jgi:plasmid stability protein
MRITVNVSEETAQVLREMAASSRRSMAAEAGLILEQRIKSEERPAPTPARQYSGPITRKDTAR